MWLEGQRVRAGRLVLTCRAPPAGTATLNARLPLAVSGMARGQGEEQPATRTPAHPTPQTSTHALPSWVSAAGGATLTLMRAHTHVNNVEDEHGDSSRRSALGVCQPKHRVGQRQRAHEACHLQPVIQRAADVWPTACREWVFSKVVQGSCWR